MPETWNEDLPVRLTTEETLERGERLALQDKLLAEAELERKASALEFKNRLSEIKAERSRLALIVREREEPRPVAVKRVEHFSRGVVEIVRMDTGEIVRSTAMTDAERQTNLPSAAIDSPLDDLSATITIRQFALDQGKSDSEADAAVEAWRSSPEKERAKMLKQAQKETAKPRVH